MKIASVANVKAHFSAYLKERESGPIVITRNGKPAAILLNVVDEDEIEGLLLPYSPRFRTILQAARAEICQTGGIPHDEFWQQVDAEGETVTQSAPLVPDSPWLCAPAQGDRARETLAPDSPAQ
jgi:prevent-host-death family protein